MDLPQAAAPWRHQGAVTTQRAAAVVTRRTQRPALVPRRPSPGLQAQHRGSQRPLTLLLAPALAPAVVLVLTRVQPVYLIALLLLGSEEAAALEWPAGRARPSSTSTRCSSGCSRGSRRMGRRVGADLQGLLLLIQEEEHQVHRRCHTVYSTVQVSSFKGSLTQCRTTSKPCN